MRQRCARLCRDKIDDRGFSLIEVIVSLMLLSIVATAVLAFFIRTTRTATEIQHRQAAATVAAQTMELVRAVTPTTNTVTSLSKLVAGRTQAQVTAQWARTTFADKTDTYPAWDTTSPTPPRILDDSYGSGVSKIHFDAEVIIGTCYRTGGAGTCTKLPAYASTPPAVAPVNTVKLYRAVVVVTWSNGAGASQCSGQACRYVLSSLIDPSTNPIFNPNYVPPPAPIAVADSMSVVGGGSGNVFATANDTGQWGADVYLKPDGSNGWTDGAHGTVSQDALNPGALLYTSTLGWSGTDTFTYTVNDVRNRTSAPGTVTVTVTPTAVADSFTGVVGQTPTALAVLTNDNGTWAATNPVAITVNPTHGSVSVSSSGVVTYTSTAGYTGADSFTYRVTDQAGSTSTATATLQVIYGPPTANNDAYSVGYNSTSTLSPLTNDVSSSGSWAATNPVRIVSTSTGTATANASGTITYQPAANFTGTATIVYYNVNSAGGASTNATITVTVVGPQTPTVVADARTVAYQTTSTIDVLTNDTSNTSPATWPSSPVAIVGSPAGVSVDTAGLVTYNPGNFTGTFTFQYKATNRDGVTSGAVTVTVTVTPPPAPTVVADSYSVTYNTAATMTVLSNDTSNSTPAAWPSNPVSFVGSPSSGSVTVNSTGVVTYTPAAGFSGTATFQYKATNSYGVASSAVTVTVTVTPPTPTVVADSVMTPYGTAVAINVLANDTAVSAGWAATNPVVISTAPSGGTTSINASTGVITYTPAAGFAGSVTFQYTAKNSAGQTSAPATVTVTVSPPPFTLVSQGKTATSSGNESAALTPNLAFDGNTGTRWSSAFNDAQWIQVDLGSVLSVKRVVLNWEAAYGAKYQIQVSTNGTTWSNVFSTTSGAGGIETIDFTATSARYVRMNGQQRATPYGYSLYEMQVYS